MKLTNEQIRAKYPQVAERIIGERAVVRKLVSKALADGHLVSVNNGEDWEIKRSTRIEDIMGAIMATDEDYIRIENINFGLEARFWMVYGNSADDVIADHTDVPYAQELFDHATGE